MNTSKITKIGILIVVAIAMMVWGVSYLKGRDIFKHENIFHVIYQDVNGLSVSNAVLINGFRVGQVVDIEYIPDTLDRFLVSFMVEEKYKVKKGSVAEVFSQDLMGTRAVRIIQSRDTVYHKDGDTLYSAIEETLKEQVNMQIAPLKKKAESLISSLDSAIIVVRSIFNEKTQENLRKTFASIKVTIANLESATFKIDTLLATERYTIARIFGNVDSITGNLKNNNEKITTILTNFSSISDSLAKADIASTLGKADSALFQFNEIITSINNGEGTVGQLINNDTLYQNIENASYHLSRLMRDLHENPKRYLHFSLLDVGKTVYVTDPEDKKAKRKAKKEEKRKQRKKKERIRNKQNKAVDSPQ